MTIRKTKGIYIRCRGVPLAEVYSSISKDLHVAYVDGIASSSLGSTPAFGGLEAGEVAVLPGTGKFGG